MSLKIMKLFKTFLISFLLILLCTTASFSRQRQTRQNGQINTRVFQVPHDPCHGCDYYALFEKNFIPEVDSSGQLGTGTFVRASVATYERQSDQQIVTAPVNTMRFTRMGGDTSGVSPMCGMLEPQSTNIHDSTDINAATWAKTQCTVNDDAVTAPDGTTTGDGLTDNGNDVDHYVTEAHADGDFTNDAYVSAAGDLKAGAKDWAKLSYTDEDGTENNCFFNLDAGTVGTCSAGVVARGMIPTKYNWWRCWIVADNDAAGGAPETRIYAANADTDSDYAGATSDAIYIANPQTEELPYPSSRITTGGGTRVSEDPAAGNGLSYLLPSGLFSGSGSGTMMIRFWSPYNSSDWTTIINSGTLLVGAETSTSGILYIHSTGRLSSTDGTSFSNAASSVEKGWNIGWLQWNYFVAGAAKFRMGYGNPVTWGTEQVYDGSFKIAANAIQFGNAIDVPICIRDMIIWKGKKLSDTDCNDFERVPD